ncbi:NAD(P)/FAD-dependent oxidoreductase [Rhizobium sp. P28RR-XV]|uniref:NAD(P)/FAD-dependent oxidoreductase n=1 Tax=Rhizobium sp. P28RR-XV TaxID=2726737 RepID=UPI00145664A3|nr:FAD-binding oxidoreductase [Rhizobium sp. P28RR-XV]NLR85419.1 FAD-binding oxidoreductase [Rhizobium sp. P28RR-XV]
MTKFAPFDESYWYASAQPAPETGPLVGEATVDVCIVGAGYTGLTTAIELSRKGVSVALLERREAGYGGSGRNAGHCSPTFSYYTLEKVRSLLGEPWAERLIRRQTRAADKAGEYIAHYGIDCEWVQNGLVIGAMRPGHVPALEHKTESYNAVGAKTRMLGRDEAIAITGSPRMHGGWINEDGAHLHPLKYARGLARGAMSEGAALYTGSPANRCERQGAKWKVISDRGHVIADKVIFATGAYTVDGWPDLEKSYRILPIYVCATNCLSDRTRETVLPDNNSMIDGRGDFYCYKWTADNRIVASMFILGQRGRDPAYTKRVMTDKLLWLYPQITEEVSWDYYWFGELDMQYRTVPRLYGLAPGVVALTGLSGRGVPTGTMLGGILSDWAIGVSERDLDLRIEPLHQAPRWMDYAPSYKLREMRLVDNFMSKRGGIELPPHH